MMKYAAFISYAHSDEKIARRIHNALETYPLPKRETHLRRAQLSPIFRDVTELTVSHSLSEKIQEALVNSNCLIVICSPAAQASQWVNEEIRMFREFSGETTVLSVIVDGDPSTAFPAALTEGGREPLAANMTTRDGFRFGITQLAASMLGVGLDRLIRRERKRSRQRVIGVTTLVSVIMVLMASLTWVAFEARQEADKRRTDAEQQIEFMITDLKDKLSSVGSLDAMQAVGERANFYYENYDLSDHDASALGRRARVYHYLGEIQDKFGNLDAANQYFQQAYDATNALLARNPRGSDPVFEHAQSAYWVGDNYYRQNDFQTALEYFEEYSQLANTLQEVDRSSVRALEEIASANTNVGLIQLYLGNIEPARKRFEISASTKERLYKSNPDDINTFIGLLNSYEHLLELDLARADIPQAINRLKAAERQIAQSMTGTQTDARILYKRLRYMRFLTRLYMQTAQFKDASDHLIEGVAIAGGLLFIEPRNVDVIYEDVALMLLDFDLAYLSGDTAEIESKVVAIQTAFVALPSEFENSQKYQKLSDRVADLPLYVAISLAKQDVMRVLALERRTTLKKSISSGDDLLNDVHKIPSFLMINLILRDPYTRSVLDEACRNQNENLNYYSSALLGQHTCGETEAASPTATAQITTKMKKAIESFQKIQPSIQQTKERK